MAYSANQYNHATPLSSAAGLASETSVVADLKYFTLSNNTLDGTYCPISGDVGLWGTIVSDADGNLSEPFVITIDNADSMRHIRITGSKYCYPVDFSIGISRPGIGDSAKNVTGNTKVDYVFNFPAVLITTKVTISISKISAPNSVARVYNAYVPHYIKRTDKLITRTDNGDSAAYSWDVLKPSDSVSIKIAEKIVDIKNTFSPLRDALSVHTSDSSVLTNVHSRMKDPSRRIYGKVYVTYTDPMLDSITTFTTNTEAYNSRSDQVFDGANTNDTKFFSLYANDLSGDYQIMSEDSQVGWVSGVVSDSQGRFVKAPYLRIDFSVRPVSSLTLYFDTSNGGIAKDFTVELIHEDDSSTLKSFVDNASPQVLVNEERFTNVKAIILHVTKIDKPYCPVVLLEMPLISTILYRGYEDASDLISIDLLEELTYDDNIEALGGISANETTVVLDNSNSDFYFNNKNSAIASQLRRNRKIEPWLGTEIVPGEIEWYKLGTFWSYSWNVPVNSLTATVVGFDTIGLLDTSSYTKHQVYLNKSIGALIEAVLNDAKETFSFITMKIDPALYEVIIPYAWFEAGSHTAALRKISQAYPMHIYCDRDGSICAAPQKLKLDYYYDVWSDNTNVISKEYSSLYTTLPNIVNVKVITPNVVSGDSLVQDSLAFDIADVPTRTLNFGKPYLSDIIVTVDKDASVSYTYEVYSWGIELSFTGSGMVRSIQCVGTALDTSNTATLTHRNEDSILLNGAVTRDVAADFIQTASVANTIISRIATLSEYDKYDATVNYRGDIALSINDPILLLNGIAPDNRYNIRRHQLTWNGALTGSADLNT